MDNIIEFQNVTYYYPNAEKPSLAEVSFAVESGTFVLLVGATGSGKSTLIKLARGLHVEFGGKLSGVINISSQNLVTTNAHDLGDKVGIVFQNPAYQLHQPRVIDEIMSAPLYQGLPWLECIDRAQNSIRGVLDETLLDRNPRELSSGQQQRVALSAALSMQAEILLLDEPFSYLDLLSQRRYVEILAKLKAKGMTIILATHDLDPVAELADRVILLAKGRIVDDGGLQEVVYGKSFQQHFGLPLWLKLGQKLIEKQDSHSLPKSIDDVVKILQSKLGTLDGVITSQVKQISNNVEITAKEPLITLSNVTFGYSNNKRVLNNVSLAVNRGDVLGLVGANGCGKSTLALLLLGLLNPGGGTIRISGKNIKEISSLAQVIGYVTQDPRNMLFESTVYNECLFGPKSLGLSNAKNIVSLTLNKFGLAGYWTRDPLSLSGGEQRLLTFADVIVNNPEIIILDEPEFGLDPISWEKIANTIRDMQRAGKTIILITHRLEVTLFLCNRLALMRQGKIIAIGDKMDILGDNRLFSGAEPQFGSLALLVNYLRTSSNTLLTDSDLIDAFEVAIGNIKN